MAREREMAGERWPGRGGQGERWPGREMARERDGQGAVSEGAVQGRH